MNDKEPLVYVVDDDSSAREGVARLIRSAGLLTETFASAEEFLAAPRLKLPSCLVLDMRAGALCRIHDLARRRIEDAMVERLEPDADVLAVHCDWMTDDR
jgi:FixJ family two-component response regulator